ncbi:MAG: formylglycine-generating enzyme family protein [Treponema sp.]
MKKIILMFFCFCVLFSCKQHSQGSFVEIKIAQSENGLLIAELDGKPFSGGKVQKGKTVSFIAKPASCFVASVWNGAVAEKNNFRKAYLVANEDKTVSVQFKAIPNVKTIVSVGSPIKIGYGEVTEGKWKIHYRGSEIKEDFVVAPYAIGITEVPYNLWKEVLDWAKTNGYFFEHEGQKGANSDEGAYNAMEHDEAEPVTKISWRDAIVWCNAYTEKLLGEAECVYCGIGGIPLRDSRKKIETLIDAEYIKGKIGFRFPTEPEWEFAARGGEPTAPDWKYKFAGGDSIDEVVWYKGNSNGKTHKANEGKPNKLGLYNMCGNVWEYISDKHFDDVTDPRSTMRCGGFVSGEEHCQIERRVQVSNFDWISTNWGFRLAFSLTE